MPSVDTSGKLRTSKSFDRQLRNDCSYPQRWVYKEGHHQRICIDENGKALLYPPFRIGSIIDVMHIWWKPSSFQKGLWAF